MEFTQIDNENPVVLPATEEKVYDKLWLSHIRINSPSKNNAIAIAHLVPYNGSEVLEGPVEQVVVPNVFEAMQDADRPESLKLKYVQLMELLLQTIKEEKAYQDAKKLQENIEEESPVVEESEPEVSHN